MDVQTYFDAIKFKLATSPIIKKIHIIQEHGVENAGFFRARLYLENDDFVEIAEFFMIESGQTLTIEYRYQWMNSSKQLLRKRWDNAAHHPGLPNFPHHVHVGDDKRVEPGNSMGIILFIDMLENEIDAHL
jgi:hypothetical protein